jgi:cytochrome c-type biogenesis protein CcmH/NrfG
MLTMFAALIVVLPWLRTIPRFASLPAVPWQAPLIAFLVIGAALAMYGWLGRPELAAQLPAQNSQNQNARAMRAPGAGANGNAAAGSMNAAIDSLRARLAQGSGSPDDWELLAKSYDFIGRPDDAQQARAHRLPAAPSPATGAAVNDSDSAAPVAALSPESLKLLSKAAQERHDKQYAAAAKIYKQLAAENQMNADAWADYADTTGTVQGNRLAGEPEAFIARALALDANHPKALWLKASADEEADRYGDAIAAWQRLQAVLPPDSQDAKIVAANLQRDREAAANIKADAAGKSAPGGASAAAVASAAGNSISGEVSISSTLSSRAAPGATLFIVAKSVDQPGPPVAVYRGSVTAWPVKFTLDDSSSMLPGRNLTNAKRVTVEARISRSGQAQPATGDLRGITGVIDPSSHQPLKIVINEVVT